MKILDWRPEWEKHFLRRWENPAAVSPDFPLSSSLGRIWQRTVDGWMARRVRQRLCAPEGPRVVSVGNLALGGTGKTPLIMALARDLASQGLQGAVLTRGYRSPLPGPLKVEPEQELAGDEARLMAGVLAPFQWTVVQARQRKKGLAFLQASQPELDFILLEDGHQTGQVGRHLDLLILDRWEVVEDGSGRAVLAPAAGPVFPLGPYRESRAGAARAGILVVESETPVALQSTAGQPVATFSRQGALRQVCGRDGDFRPEGLAVLSGIARHAAFELSLRRLTGMEPQLAIRLRDHQHYGPRLVGKIIQTLDGAGASGLITTAKDWIKLEPFWPGQHPVFVVDLEIRWGTPHVLPQLVREHVGR